jgi:cell division control protein 24
MKSERAAQIEVNQKPSDDRAFIVRELLESERKYVQDLEVLQTCSKALQQYDILSPDRLHDLFSNLNNLVDFQRRCLIHLEDNARKPPEEQRFGRAFIMLVSTATCTAGAFPVES